MSQNRSLILLIICILLLGGGWYLISVESPEFPTEVQLPETVSAYEQKLATLFQQSDLAEASRLILADEESTKEISSSQLYKMGETLAQAGWLLPAESCLEFAVEKAPQKRDYRLRLAMLYYVTGRYSAALSNWEVLLRTGGMDLISMPALGNRSIRWSYEDATLEKGFEHTDPLALLGMAHKSLQKNELKACETYATQALHLQPNLLAANEILGRCYYEQGDQVRLREWLASLTDSADHLAETWVLKGHYFREQEQTEGALRCYWEAFQRDPCDYVATEQIGRMLHALGQAEIAQSFTDRATRLRKYEGVCRKIHASKNVTESQMRTAAMLTAELQCTRESLGWCSMAKILFPESTWPLAASQLLKGELHPESGRFNLSNHPKTLVDLSAYSYPKISSEKISKVISTSHSSAISFEDATDATGIDFVFEDGSDASTSETLLFEFTGGGVAVLDFDCNGSPDLFFTQGGPPPIFPKSLDSAAVNLSGRTAVPSDKLFSMIEGGRYTDVTQLAGLTDAAYGQGCTVGDFNSDGFPDLYLANIGANVLYENMGDGTFQSLNLPILSSDAAWTTSCLMADLDGDTHPDFYDVNYVIPTAIHTQMCISGEASVPCKSAHHLVPALDRLLQNEGDGTFSDVTQSSGTAVENGLGLGVIAADFGEDGRLDLFVANDARPNFLFINQTEARQPLSFSEEALIRGIALSAAGREQACMGVAAGDADGDGQLDLFVTNFYADYNVLYHQLPGEFFEDRSQAAGLKTVSYQSLGFGTQFLDAELDGDADLVLTNGDVVDFRNVEPERRYFQQAQFLENRGQGRFTEIPSSRLGPYFEKELLGRGLARLDWNRDGREEFVVSHINQPARLLKNTSETAGNFLKIMCVGTQSNRDAIGTRVRITTDTGTFSKQLTAGDGYLASNERCLTFGIGKSDLIEKVVVNWPSGKTSLYQKISVDQTILLIESIDRFYVIE